jgi:hypothetical protein
LDTQLFSVTVIGTKLTSSFLTNSELN